MRRADALFNRVLPLSAEERIVELDAVRARSPALATLVEQLLHAWEASEGGDVKTGAAMRHLAGSVPLASGSRLGPFVIDALLGHGGMGAVYAAHRLDGQFEQAVAIKRILDSPLLDRARAAEHLTRERALLARLRHPGLATVLDGGIDEDGYPWLAMELIDGRRLDRYLTETQPSFESRFALLLQLVDAVGYAHRQLVVHGDLKPANLMVERDGRLRVLDFGIARSLAEDHRTAASSAATPGWSSPEQRRSEQPGTASDHYQVGLLARTMLANGLRGEADRGGNLRELARSNALAFHSRLDAELDAIVGRCLADAPAQRYPDFGTLRTDLVAWRDRRPISLFEHRPLYRLRCFMRRNPIGSALAASLLAVLCTGSLVLWQQNRSLRDATAAAQSAAAHALAEIRRQDQVLGFLEATLTAADPRGSAGAVQSVDALLDVAADGIDVEFETDASLRTEVRAMLAFIALRREDHARAGTLLGAAENDATVGIRPRALASLQLLQGDMAFYAGDAQASEALYRQALTGLQGDSLRQANWRIYLRNQLINAMRLHGREAEARELVPALREDLERYPVRAENKAASYTFMALVESDTGRALALHRRSYDVLAERLGPNEPTVIRRLSNVAGATLAHGDVAAALDGYAEAMRRVAERGELESDYFITPQGVYGRLLSAHGRWDEAKVWLERATRLQAAARGKSSPLYLYVRGDLMQWQIERTPSLDLLAELDRWLALNETLIGRDHPRSRHAWRLRIALLRRLGRSSEAYDQWLEQQARPWQPSPQQTMVDAQWRADGAALLLDLGRRDEGCEQLAGMDASAVPGTSTIDHLALAMDLALCAAASDTSSSATYANSHAALARVAGDDDWRLARRPAVDGIH